jgi:hypothetical protein
MDAKSKLKKLIAGEMPPLADGTYTDQENVYQVNGNIGIYRKKKACEDVSKLRPMEILTKLKEDDIMVFLPDNGRC